MPLLKGSSKKVVSQNISEFHTGKTYAKTLHKFGSKKANAQAVAVALSTARKYARKAEGGADLEDPRMKAIGIRTVEGTPDAPESLKREAPMAVAPPISDAPKDYQPIPAEPTPSEGSWGPPIGQETTLPANRRGPLTRAYEGAKHAITEGGDFGMSGETLAKYPGMLPFQPVAAAGDLALRGLSGAVHGAAGLAGGVAEDFGTQAEGDRMERDISQLANVAMPEFASPLGIHSIPPAAKAAWETTRKGAAAVDAAIPQNAAAMGMGKLTQPTMHPKPDDFGSPVPIKNPTQPSFSETWADPTQTATFSAGQTFVPHELNGTPFQKWTPPQDWVEYFKQNPVHVPGEPEFHPHDTKATSTGTVILEPDGRVWLTVPSNKFGGYEASFPKGHIEDPISLAENAVKETFEETGLKVKILSHLIDVDKSTTRNRYYLATREGGTPSDMGWESQGLHLANIHDVGKYLNKPTDMEIVDALKKFASEHGQPKAAPEAAPEPQAPLPKTTKNVPHSNGKYFGQYWHPYDLDPKEVKQAKLKSKDPTKGSNPGGVYEMPDGTPVYIKQAEGDHAIERIYNEKLANEFLKLTGVPVTDVRMTQFKGKPSIVSYMVPGKELTKFPLGAYSNLAGLTEHYPAHLWLQNYDYIGNGGNIMVMPDGQTIHIDPGGAMRFRAQGKKKGPDLWGPNVEHFKMFPGTKTTAALQGKLDSPAMKKSAQRVANVTDHQIHDLVQQYGPLQKGEKAKLEETLKARRDGVAKMYGVQAIKQSTTFDSLYKMTAKQLSASGHKVQTWQNGTTTIIQNGKTTTTPGYIAPKPAKAGPSPLQDIAAKMPKPSTYGQAVANEMNNIKAAEPKKAPPPNFDPKAKAQELYEGYRGDVDEIAEHLFEYQKDYGKKVADQIGEKLPMSVRMEVGDALSDLESQREQLKEHPVNPESPKAAPAQEPFGVPSHEFGMIGSMLRGNHPAWDQFHEWHHKLAQEPINLTDPQKASVGFWGTAEGYKWINGFLRGHEKYTSNAQAAIEFLREAMANNPIKENASVWRGVHGPQAAILRNLKPGDTFYNKGFTATTVDPRQSTHYAAKDADPVIINYHLPAGHPSLYVSHPEAGNYIQSERELLLPDSNRYKILKTEKIKAPLWHYLGNLVDSTPREYTVYHVEPATGGKAHATQLDTGKSMPEPFSEKMAAKAREEKAGSNPGDRKAMEDADWQAFMDEMEKAANGPEWTPPPGRGPQVSPEMGEWIAKHGPLVDAIEQNKKFVDIKDIKLPPGADPLHHSIIENREKIIWAGGNPDLQVIKGGDKGHPHELPDMANKYPNEPWKTAKTGAWYGSYEADVSMPYGKHHITHWVPLPTKKVIEMNFNDMLVDAGHVPPGEMADSRHQFRPTIRYIRDKYDPEILILHDVLDQSESLGSKHATQVLVFKTNVLRAPDARMDPEKSHLRESMAGLAGLGIVGAYSYSNKDKDQKMARGGKVKFKPFSSIGDLTGLDEGYQHKPYKKTVGAGKKAVRTAKHFARGGATEPEPKEHEFINFAKGGMINSNIPGRTDKIPMKVATGAYVLPADIPSALGQGNTIAGKSILDKMFNSGPYGLPLAKGKTSKFQMPHLKGFAEGGETDDHTPIIAAGGEYIINPDEVMRQGNGSMTAGHKVLDAFVLHTRKKHIETLKGLKGPK